MPMIRDLIKDIVGVSGPKQYQQNSNQNSNFDQSQPQYYNQNQNFQQQNFQQPDQSQSQWGGLQNQVSSRLSGGGRRQNGGGLIRSVVKSGMGSFFDGGNQNQQQRQGNMNGGGYGNPQQGNFGPQNGNFQQQQGQPQFYQQHQQGRRSPNDFYQNERQQDPIQQSFGNDSISNTRQPASQPQLGNAVPGYYSQEDEAEEVVRQRSRSAYEEKI